MAALLEGCITRLHQLPDEALIRKKDLHAGVSGSKDRSDRLDGGPAQSKPEADVREETLSHWTDSGKASLLSSRPGLVPEERSSAAAPLESRILFQAYRRISGGTSHSEIFCRGSVFGFRSESPDE